MPVPRRRHSRTRQAKRRTHFKLGTPNAIIKCEKCGESKLPHRVCPSCGTYKAVKYAPSAPKD